MKIMNLKNIFTREYIGGYYKRNQKVIKLALIIFVLLFLLGFFTYNINNLGNDNKSLLHSKDLQDNLSNALVDKNTLLSDSNFEGFIELYSHNLFVDLFAIFGGLLFSIPTLFFTAENVAMFGGIFSTVQLPLLLTSIIPHGIFEIPSSFFGLVGGLMFTQFELRILRGLFSGKSSVKSEWNNSQDLLKDILLTIIIVIILLFIAALIELFVTPYLILMFIG